MTWTVGVSGNGVEKLTRALSVSAGMRIVPEVSALTLTGPWNQAKYLKTVGVLKNRVRRPFTAVSDQETSVARTSNRGSGITCVTSVTLISGVIANSPLLVAEKVAELEAVGF